MKRFAYTEREQQIIQAKGPMAITDEEFLALCHKAHWRSKIEHTNHLERVYPEISSRVSSKDFIAKHDDPADRERFYSGLS